VFDVPCRRSVLPAPDRRIVGLLLLGLAVLLLAAGAGLGAPSPADARPRLTQCNDNIDNDGDGLPDNRDPGCAGNGDNSETDPASPAQCADEVDSERPVGDGKADFTGAAGLPPDPACDFAGGRETPDPMSIPECEDGADNETPGDGKIDWPDDPDCAWPADTNENTRVCSNGFDDDGDHKIDWPDDYGCGNPNDANETDRPQCDDGRDNDGDGTLDFTTNAPNQPDSDCSSAADDLEAPDPAAPAACADGKDNDGDGKIDFPADPGCTSAADNDETDPQLGLPLVARPCADGKDNDGDGKIDFPADPGCTSAADDDETDPISLSPSSQSRLLSPFPVVRLRGRVYPNGVRITLFTVRAPAASQVSTYCKGSSCPRKRVKILAGRRTVRVRQFERRLRAGTVLTIYVTKPGFIGKYTRFRITKGRAPLRVDRCARSPGSRARACPTS
jgi:hypothetical protein